MSGVRTRLLEFHAAHSVAELADIQAYRDFYAEHTGSDWFESQCREANQANRALRTALERAEDEVSEVMEALAVIALKVRRNGWAELCRDLVRRRFAAVWTPERLAYFDAGVDVLSGHDVFLSYTNHNPSAPRLTNVVNDYYEPMLRTLIGDRVRDNLIAQLMQLRLRELRKLDIFFWPDDQDPARKLEGRLREKVDRSLVFLQLVHSALFVRDPDEHPNYCLLEYQVANADPQRVIGLLIEPRKWLIAADELQFPAYDEWYAGLMDRAPLELLPTEGSVEALAELERIADEVAKARDRARQRLLQNVP